MVQPTRFKKQSIREYLDRGWWEPTTLSAIWDQNALDCPNKEAVVDSRGTRLTCLEAKQIIDRISFGLIEVGLKKDDLLVIQLPNCALLPLLRVSCEKAGILSLHSLMTLRSREMEYIVRFCKATGAIIFRTHRGYNYYDMFKKIRSTSKSFEYLFVLGDNVPEDCIALHGYIHRTSGAKPLTAGLHTRTYKSTEVSIITLTSGTTGIPKFAEFPFAARNNLGNTLGGEVLKLTENDILGVFGPAPAGPNCVAYFAAPRFRSKIVMQEHFDPEESLRLIQEERITVGLVVPAQLAKMLQIPQVDRYDLRTLRAWWCVGAPAPYKLRVETEQRLGGKLLTGLGAVDFGGTTATLMDDPPEVRYLTVGKGRGGTEIKVVDNAGMEVAKGEVGEIWGKGPACSTGYYRDPEATRKAWTEDGWFKFGDLGKLDEHGNLLVLGRKKDMIIRGGQNIYPIEVEELLLSHPKISDVAIVGMPDPVMGEKACAYVVPREDHEIRFDELISFLKEKGIADYKLPERLEVIDRLPLVGDQKVDKKILVQDITEKLQKERKSQGPYA